MLGVFREFRVGTTEAARPVKRDLLVGRGHGALVGLQLYQGAILRVKVDRPRIGVAGKPPVKKIESKMEFMVAEPRFAGQLQGRDHFHLVGVVLGRTEIISAPADWA